MRARDPTRRARRRHGAHVRPRRVVLRVLPGGQSQPRDERSELRRVHRQPRASHPTAQRRAGVRGEVHATPAPVLDAPRGARLPEQGAGAAVRVGVAETQALSRRARDRRAPRRERPKLVPPEQGAPRVRHAPRQPVATPPAHRPLLSAEYRDFARGKCEPPPEHIPVVLGDMEDLRRAAAFDEREDDDERGDADRATMDDDDGSEEPSRSVSRSAAPRARCAVCGDGVPDRGSARDGTGVPTGVPRRRWVGCPGCGARAIQPAATRFFRSRAAAAAAEGRDPAPPRRLVPPRGTCPSRPRTLVGRGGGGGAATHGESNRTASGWRARGARDVPIRVRGRGGRRARALVRGSSFAGRGSRSARARGRGDVVAEGGESGGRGECTTRSLNSTTRTRGRRKNDGGKTGDGKTGDGKTDRHAVRLSDSDSDETRNVPLAERLTRRWRREAAADRKRATILRPSRSTSFAYRRVRRRN